MSPGAVAPGAPVAKFGALARLFRMFTSPVAVFEDISIRPNLVLPLLLLMLCSGAETTYRYQHLVVVVISLALARVFEAIGRLHH